MKQTMKNRDFMKRALQLAARGHPSPNPKVGAVIARGDIVVGEGYHQKVGEPHAEIIALLAAGKLAKGADLYVNLEPCCHHGRTPPCTEAIIREGVRRVIAGMIDPNPLVQGKGIKTLRDAGIEVEVGVMEAEARKLNEGYIKRMTLGLPFVLWKSAMTLDGKIATRTGDSRWITSEQARTYVHKLRRWCDAIMVGIGTVLADDPELTVRHGQRGPNPLRVIVDPMAESPPGARVLSPEAPTLVAVADNAPEKNLKTLREVEFIKVGTNGRINLRSLMTELAKRGVNNVLLEGGGGLAASMLSARLIDKGLMFIVPKIVGGRDAKTPVEGEGIRLMEEALTVTWISLRRLGNDILLEFYLPGSINT